MCQIKETNIKNRTHYFFNYIISVKNFDLIQIKRDKNHYKNIDICYFGFITTKNFSYIKFNSANSSSFVIDKTDGYMYESNGNKYSTLLSTDKNK